MRPSDLMNDGTVNVRMLTAEDSPWGRGLKYAKPRVTVFLNGMHESPTLAVLRDYIASRGLGPEDYIWPSGPYAWWHWVVHRLGPYSGLQRPLPKLNGLDADEGVPRYLIHPHAARACFVMIARRYPRTIGRKPTPWDAICMLGGWDSVETIRRNYYYADLDETLELVREAMGAATTFPTLNRDVVLRMPRPPAPSELRAAQERRTAATVVPPAAMAPPTAAPVAPSPATQ